MQSQGKKERAIQYYKRTLLGLSLSPRVYANIADLLTVQIDRATINQLDLNSVYNHNTREQRKATSNPQEG